MELKGTIQCEQPNEKLLVFEGRLNIDTDRFAKNPNNPAPLTINNMALRGCVLRNTEWAYALVVYTGLNTKIIKNLKPGKVKISSLDQSLNVIVVYAFIFNMIVLAISVILEYSNYSSILDQERVRRENGISIPTVLWYIGPSGTNAPLVRNY
jgi:phospholipid-transporting ATPase